MDYWKEEVWRKLIAPRFAAAMWRGKKTRPEVPPSVESVAPATPPFMETPMPTNETISKLSGTTPASQRHTVLAQAVTVKGKLSASEDLLIEGQFEGNLSAEDHCVTIGAEGQVKAEIRARQVVILGTVTGKIVAREKVEIHRSGRLMGDLQTGSVAIEDGAYFKGSINILREDAQESSQSKSLQSALETVGGHPKPAIDGQLKTGQRRHLRKPTSTQ